MIFLLAAYAGAGGLTGDTGLTTQTLTSDSFGAGAQSCTAGVRFNADGTVDRLENSGGGGDVYTQINSGTDWIIPNDASFRTYWIRATEFSYTENETALALFGTKNGGTGTWLTLGDGQSREWSLDTSSNTAGSGDVSWVIDFDIATDGTGTNIVASGRYTLTGDVA